VPHTFNAIAEYSENLSFSEKSEHWNKKKREKGSPLSGLGKVMILKKRCFSG
jgi:hypothetical protein